MTRRHRERQAAERAADARRDGELRAEIERAILLLPDQPSRSDVERVLRAERGEYIAFAQRNAARLERIYTLLRRFMFTVGAILAIFVVTQLALGINVLLLLDGQQQGRRLALEVSCEVQSAIASQGRNVIAGPSVPPAPPIERGLERLGFPPFAQRHTEQERAAAAYVGGISRRIDRALGGHHGDGLIQSGGTINCARFQRLARASR